MIALLFYAMLLKKKRKSTTAPPKMTDCSLVIGVVRHSPYLFFCVLASGTPSKALLSFFFSLLLSRPMYCVVLYLFAGQHQKTSFFLRVVFFSLFWLLIYVLLLFKYHFCLSFCCESCFSGNLDVLIHVILFLVFPSPSPHVLYNVVVGVLKRRSYVSVRDVYPCILRFSPRYSLTFDLSVFLFFFCIMMHVHMCWVIRHRVFKQSTATYKKSDSKYWIPYSWQGWAFPVFWAGFFFLWSAEASELQSSISVSVTFSASHGSKTRWA